MNDLSDLAPQQPSENRGVVLPAEYYSTPPSGQRIVPRKVAMGCGIAALAFIVLIFAGSAIMSATGGVNKVFSMMIDVTHQQLSPMYAKDVPPAKRKEVDAAIDGVSKDLGDGRLALQQVQPILEAMKTAVEDQKVTNPECDALLKACADSRKGKGKKS